MYIGSNFKSIVKGTTKMTKKNNILLIRFWGFKSNLTLSVDNLTLFIKELSWLIISTFTCICWKTCYCAHLFTGNLPGAFERHYMYVQIIITKQNKRNKLYWADLRWHKKQQFFQIVIDSNQFTCMQTC